MENNNVRAILKPNGYKAQREFSLKEKLFEYDLSPMIAYGVDKGSHIEYEDVKDQDELKQKLIEIKKIALDNNAKIQVKHSVHNMDGVKLFVVDPHEYAAEKILDKQFLTTVAKELGTKSFLVGIPHQGVFAAIPGDSDVKGKFLGFIKQKFENPEANPITPHAFEIFQGNIISLVSEDTGGTKNAILQKGNGDLIVEMESTNLEEFKNQVSVGYSQAMLIAMKNKGFSGNIIFNENNKDFTFDTTILERCNSFVEKILTNEIAQTVSKAMSGNGITPSFTHNGKLIILSKNNTKANTDKNQDHIKKKKKWWQFGK